MAALSNYLEQALLRELFNNQNYSPPQTYIALYTSDPTDAGTGTEVSGGSYARVRVYNDGNTQPYWTNPADDGAGGHVVKNAQDITFPTATADWGTVTHFGILDSASGGNLLIHGPLTTPKPVTS